MSEIPYTVADLGSYSQSFVTPLVSLPMIRSMHKKVAYSTIGGVAKSVTKDGEDGPKVRVHSPL